MLAQVERFAREVCGLRPDEPVVVAVSGGPDSLCLLDVLHRLGYPLVVAHFHHGLRPEAEQEMAVVEAEARRRGLPFFFKRGDVRAVSGRSLEDAARHLRYTFLFRVARSTQAQAIATGHTLNDQSETLLLHLIHGSGSTGIRGMQPRTLTPWSEHIPLVRPLLQVTRHETVAYCREHGLPTQEDPTNRDPAYTPRNFLRWEVLPRLTYINPRAAEALARAADILAAEDAYLESQLDRWWAQYARGAGEAIRLDRAALLALPLALQRRALRRAGQGRADFAAVERALALARRPGGPPHPWFGGLALWVEREALWIAPQEAPPAADAPQVRRETALAPGETIPLEGEWVLQASEALPADAAQEAWKVRRLTVWEIWLDAERVTWPLRVTTPRPGLRMAPLGMGGHTRKVSDLLGEAGVPWRLRARWPVVISEEDVVWLPGVRLSHTVRVTAATRQVVRLSIQREKGTLNAGRHHLA